MVIYIAILIFFTIFELSNINIFTMEKLKKCFKCETEKPLTEFYKHPQMTDGHVNKCKECNKKDVRLNYLKISKQDGFLERERERTREKYHRLNYRVNRKIDTEKKKEISLKYKKKYPEKVKCKNLSSHLKPKIKGNHLHHWSYNVEHAKDVIELSLKDHYKVHRFIRYDKKTFMYKDLNGVLLNTKEKHIEYITKVINNF